MIDKGKVKAEDKVWTFSFTAIIFIAVLVCMCVSVIIPVMPIIMKNGGFTYSFISYAFTALIAGRLISSNLTGRLLDKYHPNKILIWGFTLHAITMFSFVYVRTELVFVAFRFLEGVFEGIVSVVLQLMVIALSNPQNRGRKMGIFSAANGLGFIIGPALGGVALRFGGPDRVFITVAVAMLFGLVWLGLIYKVLTKEITISAPAKRSFNFEFVKYLPLYGGAILQRGLFVALSILLPLFLVDYYKLQAYEVGYFFTASAVITTLLMPVTGRLADGIYKHFIVIISMVTMGVSIIGFGLISNPVVFTSLFLIETVAFSFMVPSSMKIFGDIVAGHPNRGQIIGAASSAREILNIIMVTTLAPIYQYKTTMPWLLLGLMSILLALPYIKDMRKTAALTPIGQPAIVDKGLEVG